MSSKVSIEPGESPWSSLPPEVAVCPLWQRRSLRVWGALLLTSTAALRLLHTWSIHPLIHTARLLPAALLVGALFLLRLPLSQRDPARLSALRSQLGSAFEQKWPGYHQLQSEPNQLNLFSHADINHLIRSHHERVFTREHDDRALAIRYLSFEQENGTFFPNLDVHNRSAYRSACLAYLSQSKKTLREIEQLPAYAIFDIARDRSRLLTNLLLGFQFTTFAQLIKDYSWDAVDFLTDYRPVLNGFAWYVAGGNPLPEGKERLIANHVKKTLKDYLGLTDPVNPVALIPDEKLDKAIVECLQTYRPHIEEYKRKKESHTGAQDEFDQVDKLLAKKLRTQKLKEQTLKTVEKLLAADLAKLDETNAKISEHLATIGSSTLPELKALVASYDKAGIQAITLGTTLTTQKLFAEQNMPAPIGTEKKIASLKQEIEQLIQQPLQDDFHKQIADLSASVQEKILAFERLDGLKSMHGMYTPIIQSRQRAVDATKAELNSLNQEIEGLKSKHAPLQKQAQEAQAAIPDLRPILRACTEALLDIK